MHSAGVPFLGAINCAPTLADLSYKIEITDYSVLYHVSESNRFARVKWLVERLSVLCFVPICLLVSPIFAGFLSVMLSVMLSAFSSWLLMCGLFGLQMASHSERQKPLVVDILCKAYEKCE